MWALIERKADGTEKELFYCADRTCLEAVRPDDEEGATYLIRFVEPKDGAP